MADEMDTTDVNVVMEEEEKEPVQDLTNSDVVTKYKLAAEIANKTMDGLSRYCKPGKKIVDVCALGDSLIEQQCQSVFKSKKIEKGSAFPTSVSVNEVVCHMSPLPSESEVLAEGDLIKIDLGVHIDGYIAVVAHTIVCQETPAPVSGPMADLVSASYLAAEAAVKTIKPGVSNADVTEIVKKCADDFGVNLVQGVLMHQMKRFVIDGNNVVLQREETNQKVEMFEYEDAQVYTVDVVMSTGEGKPIQRDARTTIFKRAVDQTYKLKMKASRYVFNEVSKRFPTLPFTIRALDEMQGRMGVVECVKHNLLHPYPVLYEKPGSLVAHFKYTVLLLPSGTAKITGAAVDLQGAFPSEKPVSDDVKAVLARSAKSGKKKKKKNKKKAAAADTDAMDTN